MVDKRDIRNFIEEQEYVIDFLQKAKLEVAVANDLVEQVVDAICKAAVAWEKSETVKSLFLISGRSSESGQERQAMTPSEKGIETHYANK